MCPREVDQPVRFVQFWQILAPRLKQCQKLSPLNDNNTNSPQDILFMKEKSWDAWSKLAKPVESGLLRVSRGPRPSSCRANIAASRLECMPAELLKMVFGDGTLEKQDVVALGLCSQSLWLHMLRHVESAYRKFAAPWAGIEIACTGPGMTRGAYLHALSE
jgi:hypothetical protein